jgi:hypothetical protein
MRRKTRHFVIYRKRRHTHLQNQNEARSARPSRMPEAETAAERPQWLRPVTSVLEIEQLTLSKAGGDADSCDSTHGAS